MTVKAVDGHRVACSSHSTRAVKQRFVVVTRHRLRVELVTVGYGASSSRNRWRGCRVLCGARSRRWCQVLGIEVRVHVFPIRRRCVLIKHVRHSHGETEHLALSDFVALLELEISLDEPRRPPSVGIAKRDGAGRWVLRNGQELTARQDICWECTPFRIGHVVSAGGGRKRGAYVHKAAHRGPLVQVLEYAKVR